MSEIAVVVMYACLLAHRKHAIVENYSYLTATTEPS